MALFDLDVRSTTRKPDPEGFLRERAQLRRAVSDLLGSVRRMSLDLEEVGSAQLERRIDALLRRVDDDERLSDLGPAITAEAETLASYAERARAYLDEHEHELKEIITALSRGLSALEQCNASFNQGVQARAQRIERVSQLDDLRQLRQELNEEVRQLRFAVQEKQRRDDEQVSGLHRQMAQLRDDVIRARSEALRDPLTGVGKGAEQYACPRSQARHT